MWGLGLRFKSRIFRICLYLRKDTSRGYTCLSGLSGILPAEAMIHKRILSLYGNITRLSSDSVEYQLAKRQLEVKSFTSHSWFIAVKKILIKY